MHTRSTFTVESWDESTVQEGPDGRKLTSATVKQTITGDITGTGLALWLMSYRPDGTADYLGLQQVEGKLGERAGTFVCSSMGSFDGQTAEGTLEVLAGSGSGDFEAIGGSGTFSAEHGSAAKVELEATLA